MPTRKPFKRIPVARSRPNPAAAALGVGVSPDKWTPDGIIHAITNRYLQLIKLAEEAKDKGDTRRQRLSQAGAYELALIVASYYQDQGKAEDFLRWERRSKQSSAVAYRTTNPVAHTLGADPPPESSEPEV